MKISITIIILLILLAGTATGEDWIALWTWDDSWVGMNTNGEVRQYVPGTDAAQLVGTFGDGPWAAFSRNNLEILAMKPNGEIWAMNGLGVTRLFLSLPADRQWCALLLVPEVSAGPYFALTCSGEIWTASEPPRYNGTFEGPVPTKATTFGAAKGLFR